MFGTHSALDALDGNFQFVHQLNRDEIYAAVQEYFDAQNMLVNEFVDEFCTRTTDNLWRIGGQSTPMKMGKLGEIGRNLTQKAGVVYDIAGAPIDRYGSALQWTADYFRRVRADQFANVIRQIGLGDINNVYFQVRNAFFNNVNYTFNESANNLVDFQSNDIPDIPIKGLANGDVVGWNGAATAYPIKPHGVVVPSNHNHYLAINSAVVTKVGLTTLLNTVIEHQESGMVIMAINLAEEDGMRALAPDFLPYTDPNVILPMMMSGTTATTTGGVTTTQPIGYLMNQSSLDDRNTYNRRIGRFKQAEVWVKPWVPAGYVVCYIKDTEKVLAFRYRDTESSELRLTADENVHPLHARQYEREFGVAVKNRVKAAVLQLRADANPYSPPVL